MTPANHRVLAFIRQFGDETVLVVANLSRFVQYVELDLSAWKGMRPVELIGHTEFPAIGELPYLLTLGGHAFYWFSLGRLPPAKKRGVFRRPTTHPGRECCPSPGEVTLVDALEDSAVGARVARALVQRRRVGEQTARFEATPFAAIEPPDAKPLNISAQHAGGRHPLRRSLSAEDVPPVRGRGQPRAGGRIAS